MKMSIGLLLLLALVVLYQLYITAMAFPEFKFADYQETRALTEKLTALDEATRVKLSVYLGRGDTNGAYGQNLALQVLITNILLLGGLGILLVSAISKGAEISPAKSEGQVCG